MVKGSHSFFDNRQTGILDIVNFVFRIFLLKNSTLILSILIQNFRIYKVGFNHLLAVQLRDFSQKQFKWITFFYTVYTQFLQIFWTKVSIFGSGHEGLLERGSGWNVGDL